MQPYDLIVIGAGSAGLMAAREFTKTGKNFIIFESNSQIGYPLRCAEITREETFFELFDCMVYPFIQNKITHASFQVKKAQKK